MIRSQSSEPAAAQTCWCGGDGAQPFSDHYDRCGSCGTLISRWRHDRDVTRVRSESDDFYGERYWFADMESRGFGNFHSRARTDLAERAPYWLQTLLKYQLPPGATLEVGCGHGAAVALLQFAGFDAAGLEVSPAVAALARQTFAIEVLEGPLEDQQLPPGRCAAVLMMDVLEHLPSPLTTMRAVAALLSPGGVALVQTPCAPDSGEVADLRASASRFEEMLLEREHLFLFTAASVQELLRRAGLPSVVFEPALFPHYDMFLAAAAAPLTPIAEADRLAALAARPAGRMTQAVLDLYTAHQSAAAGFVGADRDRVGRAEIIDRLSAELAVSERDRAARLSLLTEADRRIGTLDAEISELKRLLAARGRGSAS